MPDSPNVGSGRLDILKRRVKFALQKFLLQSTTIEAEVKLLEHEASALEDAMKKKKIKKLIDTLPL